MSRRPWAVASIFLCVACLGTAPTWGADPLDVHAAAATARVGAQRAFDRTTPEDAALRLVDVGATVEASVVRWLAVRADANYGGPGTSLMGSGLGVRAQLLQQEHHSVDLGVVLSYRPDALRGEGLLMALLAIRRQFHRVRVLADLSYGQDPEADDRRAGWVIAATYSVSPSLRVGAEGRAEVTFSNDDKRGGRAEPSWDAFCGPTLGYAIGPVAVVVEGGPRITRMSGIGGPAQGETERVGIAAFGGVGGAL